MPGTRRSESSRRIVLTTFGSLGDLHPYIAIALGLKERGHDPLIATMDIFQDRVESAGLAFRPLRSLRVDHVDQALMKQAMDARTGTEFIIRKLLMPSLADAYEDTMAATEGADLLISHPMTVATRLVAEVRGTPWVSTHLAPIGFLSPHDPPVFGSPLGLSRLRALGPTFHRPWIYLLKRMVRHWSEPYHLFRGELGLPPSTDPLFDGMRSPFLILALFSKLLGHEQPDWPKQTVATGFAFYDHDGDSGMTSELVGFLDAGPPPIVFTLGSAAVMDAGRFYQESAEAARRLGRRAVLLVGKDTGNRPGSLPDGVVALDYAPFSELFPRACAIVHQGGVGTTGQAIRSGRPMLVMPYAHDQPDNADRVRRLGIARTIARSKYNADRATRELRTLLDKPSYARRAAEVGEQLRQEDGVGLACDALETLLSRASESSSLFA